MNNTRKARLDTKGDARPLTQIVSEYPNAGEGQTIGPGLEESYTILNVPADNTDED